MSIKISTDKAIDMLPSVVDMWDKLGIDEYRKELSKKYKGNSEQAGIDVIKHVIKNIKKVKVEIIEAVSIIEEKDIEEIKNQNIIKTINTLKEAFSDKELVGFFSSAMGSDTEEQ